MTHDKTATTKFMTDFEPLAVLWNGENAPFPSEVSARWAMRQLRSQLAQAGALAVHRGRIFVRLQSFTEVAQRMAIEAARQRYGCAPRTCHEKT